jgi:UDP-N-acetylglucosamine 1-carboxyvinyltransferase
MDKFVVHGGNPLRGTLRVSGSKNSALPILAATLLTPEPCIIHNVPNLSDIRYMLDILRHLGAEVTFDQGTVRVCAEKIHSETSYDLVRKMRASICVLGPLLARLGQATISLPGGCVIGDRPIDLHLKGLETLQAQIQFEEGNVIAKAPQLIGTEVFLGGKFGSTVLGTDNIMMAATRAQGMTIIESAACEPEVKDLAEFLIKMGAQIQGHGTRRIEIQGVQSLHGVEHTVIPDRIEAGTFMVGALISNGQLKLTHLQPDHLTAVTHSLKQAGADIQIQGNTMDIGRKHDLKSIEAITETYPGFPTDMQAQFCAMMSVVSGISVITEKIFPNRYMHISELKRMGAKIDIEGQSAIIHGVDHLSGAPVMASDLRASAALVLAGLVAKGTTTVNRVYHIDRGYEKIDERLRSVGADIERMRE